jgi:hypothetical protein
MARIRTIKPEFFTSSQVVECSPIARLMFVGLWCFCDDGGVHPDDTRRIKMEVFPGDDLSTEAVAAMVDELLAVGLLARFSAAGASWLCVTGWHHQKIDRPTFRFPQPEKSPNGRQSLADNSSSTRRADAEASPPEGSRLEGKGVESNGRVAAPPCGTTPDDVIKAWNATAGTRKVRKLTPGRRKQLRTRLSEADWEWRTALAKFPLRVCASDPAGWQPDLDWFLRPDSVNSILEGRYDFSKDRANGRHNGDPRGTGAAVQKYLEATNATR